MKHLKNHVMLATQRQELWFSSMKIMEDCRAECKWLSARLTRETCPNDRRQPGVKSECGWGEVGSSLWGPRTPCGIWRCMMVMLYVRCWRLRRAKSFCRTCQLWKVSGKKWLLATRIAFHISISCSRYLVGASRATRDAGPSRLLIEVLRAPKPRISFKLFGYR